MYLFRGNTLVLILNDLLNRSSLEDGDLS
jgi:hypothetical protein